jgi:hypothetical protein
MGVLKSSALEAFMVRLPPAPLPRPRYEEVNEALTRIGGKWNTRRKAHLFPHDPEPLFKAVLETGEMPPKNPTAFFPTPAPVVEMLFAYVNDGRSYHRILEPSAGQGSIADALRCRFPDAALDVCEVLDLNRAVLTRKAYIPAAHDFLAWEPPAPYDLIVMNPPFAVDGDKTAWITHVERAFSMLAKDGVLVAVVPGGALFQTTKAVAAMRDRAIRHGGIEPLPEKAFEESGTNTNTAVLWMENTDQTWREREYCGWPSWHSWCAWLWCANERDLYKRSRTVDSPEASRLLFEDAAAVARKHGDPVELSGPDHWHLWETAQEATR